MKRILDCNASELRDVSKSSLIHAIRSSEGRVLVSENIVITQPLISGITNGELAASQGADFLLLNMFDADEPLINGMPQNIPPNELIHEFKRLTGRIVGVNLEAVDIEYSQDHDEIWKMKPGRSATPQNVQKLIQMGVQFIVITGNPNNGVSNRAIKNSLEKIRVDVGNDILIIVGKMHGAGVVKESGTQLVTCEDVDEYAKSGADIVLIPAPGTIPGMSQEVVTRLINTAHKNSILAMTAIGTSQEGAHVDTIRQVALMSKMAGADLHHIGDTGYLGVALPENIREYSVAIRGIRHTYARMARSIRR
ncbi:DUF7916 family protein [Vibrio diazotrophicus]|uniref:DUF7916 family protein n=1 Tax=Vibrio diazotrophicus TaxID=685 RepID=UPI000C9DB153|nr:PEP phosphonomutase [Vibrio diazotrophicus]PNH81249.1 PEP phosphonomutase [Vibrio diazotrophicus]